MYLYFVKGVYATHARFIAPLQCALELVYTKTQPTIKLQPSDVE
jgi:hypothetical protein